MTFEGYADNYVPSLAPFSSYNNVAGNQMLKRAIDA